MPDIQLVLRPATIVASAALAVTVSACGQVGSSGAHPPAKKLEGPVTTVAQASPTGSSVASPDGNLKHAKGAITALSDFTCRPDGTGSWSGSGTLTNTGTRSVRYVVTVAVIKQKTHQVLGSAQKTYSVKAKSAQPISLAHLYRGPRQATSCVPLVVRGD